MLCHARVSQTEVEVPLCLTSNSFWSDSYILHVFDMSGSGWVNRKSAVQHTIGLLIYVGLH
jgi:hypothetical protein